PFAPPMGIADSAAATALVVADFAHRVVRIPYQPEAPKGKGPGANLHDTAGAWAEDLLPSASPPGGGVRPAAGRGRSCGLPGGVGWGGAGGGVGWVLLDVLGAEARALPSAQAGELPRRLEWALAAVVFAGGLFFGFYHATTFPPGINHDAAWEGMYAIRILHG